MAISIIQKGDKVKVITGSYKGTIGIVSKVVTSKKGSIIRRRASVNTVPSIVKYRKANKAYNLPGQQLSTERLIDVSNLMHVDENGNTSKIEVKLDDKNKKTRVYKTSSKPVVKSKLVIDQPKESKETPTIE